MFGDRIKLIKGMSGAAGELIDHIIDGEINQPQRRVMKKSGWKKTHRGRNKEGRRVTELIL